MLIAIREGMDHQVVKIAQSVEHTNPKVVGSIPTLANNIFVFFLGVCDEQFFIRTITQYFNCLRTKVDGHSTQPYIPLELSEAVK